MVLITGEDPGTGLRQVKLQNAQARRVNRRVVDVDTRREFKKRAMERLPIQIEGKGGRIINALLRGFVDDQVTRW